MNLAAALADDDDRRDSLFPFSENSGFLHSGSHYGSFQLSSIEAESLSKSFQKRSQLRSIGKDGDCKFEAINVEKHKRKFMLDLFTSMLEVKWRWTLLIIFFMYFGSWSLFAGGWYAVLYFHGDLDHYGEEGWKPCVTGIHNFAAAFLFSVETQHTTGYGFYKLGDECPEAIVLMCFQSIIGVILEGVLVGLVFVRMTRAKRRSATLVFSRKAVICERDGKLTLMFRLGDLRTKTHLLQTTIRAQVIRRKATYEGEIIHYHQEELEVNSNMEKTGRILLFWPTTVSHTIDQSSPLYHLHPTDLNMHNNSFEVIVVLEGIVESTGLLVQARTSYLPSEILWGHRFEDLATDLLSSSGERVIDYSRFHETYPITTTTSSAAEMDSGGSL